MKHYKGSLLIVLLVLIVAEIIWSWRKDKKLYSVKGTLSNLSILAGFQFSKLLFAGYQLTILGWASDMAVCSLPANAWTFGACFILADFAYYWFHRVSHIWEPLWAFHLIHHSSQTMNLTTAYRLNWFGALVSPVFFVPLAVLGFSPTFIVASYALNLLYQFFLHTEAIGKLGVIEGIMDTPSAHRVHHGSNPLYLDKNFGGVLIIWDKIFHTYQPETEKVRYGLTTGFHSNNPFKLVFMGFIDLFTGKPMLKKTNHKKTNIMKTTMTTALKTRKFVVPLFIVLAVSLSVCMNACKRNDTMNSTGDSLTVSQASDAITEAVSTEGGGMVTQTKTTVSIINDGSLSCGVESDTSISGQNTVGASVTYDYDLSWNQLLTCKDDIPESFQFNFTGNTNYDAEYMSSEDSSNAQFTVTGLQPSSAQYIFNLTYQRKGSQTAKAGGTNTFTSTISITSSDLTVDKSSGEIVSGNAAVNISGATTTGRSFSFSGTLTFTGNKQATLILGNGNTYTITWS
jgi:sterol desaturase/sphingolipid hydroxylase (fatty acid hydroxylase superfamily)